MELRTKRIAGKQRWAALQMQSGGPAHMRVTLLAELIVSIGINNFQTTRHHRRDSGATNVPKHGLLNLTYSRSIAASSAGVHLQD